MVSEKNKLEKYLDKFKTEDFSLLELVKLEEELKNEFPQLGKEEWYVSLSGKEQELAERLLQRLFYKKLNVYESFISRWDKGLLEPNEEELKRLKSYQKVFEEKVLSQYAELKNQTPSIASQIEEEENISREKKGTLDRLLKNDEYRQKAEELLKKYKNSPTSPQNNPPIDKGDVNKMADLLNRVNELEEKLKQTPNSESDKQELAKLKAEIEELKNKQKDKPQPQNEKGQDKKSNFPTGLVVGGGIVIAVLLLVIIFLVRKNSK